MNIVHQLDPKRVAESIAKQIEYYTKRRVEEIDYRKDLLKRYSENPALFVREPDSVESIAKVYDDFIQTERDHYSKVRVIELPKSKRSKRFTLVYGDEDNQNVTQGTGLFLTLESAADWFYKQGR